MLTRLPAASFRRSAEIVGRFFFVKVGSLSVGHKLLGKAVVTQGEKGSSTGRFFQSPL